MGNKFILIPTKMPKAAAKKKQEPKRDLTRFVRWPRYIMMQRQRRVLYQRLRVPPAINQFTKTLTSNQSKNLWRLLAKYAPETKKDKVMRLKAAAELKASGKETQTAKPNTVKFGLNHVTH